MEGVQEMLLTNELAVAILPLSHICGLVVWWFDIVAVCGSG